MLQISIQFVDDQAHQIQQATLLIHLGNWIIGHKADLRMVSNRNINRQHETRNRDGGSDQRVRGEGHEGH